MDGWVQYLHVIDYLSARTVQYAYVYVICTVLYCTDIVVLQYSTAAVHIYLCSVKLNSILIISVLL